jgi:hypothetical protein
MVVTLKSAGIVALFVVASASAMLASQGVAAGGGMSADATKPICKYVLAADPGGQPYELCQSQAQWDALEAQYAKDANRMVCHYEELPGTKLGAHKICGPQSAWEQRRMDAREETEKMQMGVCVPGAGC